MLSAIRKEKGHRSVIAPSIWLIKSGLVKKKKEDNNDEDPATYEEAMMSPDSNKWQEAMKSEMGSMYDNKVWTLVDLPDSSKAVENKWIFKRKTDVDAHEIIVLRYMGEMNHIATGTAPSLDGELLLLMGASMVMMMAVEMAAVSMEKPSGALPCSAACSEQTPIPHGFAMAAAGNFSVSSNVVFDPGALYRRRGGAGGSKRRRHHRLARPGLGRTALWSGGPCPLRSFPGVLMLP
ncbi:hypothetical protein QYE76_049312 [Lolium multiflorum]|uniref:Retrotransposon protein, putative, Ty1-copia subclass n=1 Tax=Lolium multiflorum TaxID=4521 RepID=A0AAD8SMT2_LOLMU|nr:hypothetical protein QYE76_049312 [Lolium multiflorum]